MLHTLNGNRYPTDSFSHARKKIEATHHVVVNYPEISFLQIENVVIPLRRPPGRPIGSKDSKPRRRRTQYDSCEAESGDDEVEVDIASQSFVPGAVSRSTLAASSQGATTAATASTHIFSGCAAGGTSFPQHYTAGRAPTERYAAADPRLLPRPGLGAGLSPGAEMYYAAPLAGDFASAIAWPTAGAPWPSRAGQALVPLPMGWLPAGPLPAGQWHHGATGAGWPPVSAGGAGGIPLYGGGSHFGVGGSWGFANPHISLPLDLLQQQSLQHHRTLPLPFVQQPLLQPQHQAFRLYSQTQPTPCWVGPAAPHFPGEQTSPGRAGPWESAPTDGP